MDQLYFAKLILAISKEFTLANVKADLERNKASQAYKDAMLRIKTAEVELASVLTEIKNDWLARPTEIISSDGINPESVA